jgi:hypothetical protein
MSLDSRGKEKRTAEKLGITRRKLQGLGGADRLMKMSEEARALMLAISACEKRGAKKQKRS